MRRLNLISIAGVVFCSLILISGNAAAKQGKKAFINAGVYTMDSINPWAEAVVIEGNKFV